jgi:hypothetical protein
VSRIPGLRVGEGGEGVFADRAWAECEMIGEVCGEMMLERLEEVKEEECACISIKVHIPGGLSFCICADVSGMSNEMGLLRTAGRGGQVQGGCNSRPNVAVRCVWLRGMPSLVVVSTRAVNEGDELLLDAAQPNAMLGTRHERNQGALGDAIGSGCNQSNEQRPEADAAKERQSPASSSSTSRRVRQQPPFKQWPSHLAYSQSPSYSRVALKCRGAWTLGDVNGVAIGVIDDANHPAAGQNGLFASRPLGMASVVGEYTGTVTLGKHTGGYVACLVGYAGDASLGSLRSLLGGQTMVGIDAETRGNEMRMTNDHRGVSSEGANCSFSRGWARGGPALFVTTMRKIEEGEELLLDYGELYWEHATKAGQDNCEFGGVEKGGGCKVDGEDLAQLEQDLFEMVMQAEECDM